ncbi:MAG: hypothetical protein RBQ97_10930 [Acholeplasma sp.]|nr:hypothetical protein [Acholeplasma sp.]
MTKKEIASKIFYQIIGLVILSFGVTGIIVTNLGAGSFDAFNVFFSELIHTQPGTTTFLTSAIMAIILALIKKEPKILISMLVALLTGVFINGWIEVFTLLLNLESSSSIMKNLWFSIPFYLISMIITALGAVMLIVTKSIMSSYDEVTLYLGSKLGSYKKGKIALDGAFLILAVILGLISKTLFTQINFFTVFVVITLGPIINFMLDQYNKKKGDRNVTK